MTAVVQWILQLYSSTREYSVTTPLLFLQVGLGLVGENYFLVFTLPAAAYSLLDAGGGAVKSVRLFPLDLIVKVHQ